MQKMQFSNFIEKNSDKFQLSKTFKEMNDLNNELNDDCQKTILFEKKNNVKIAFDIKKK